MRIKFGKHVSFGGDHRGDTREKKTRPGDHYKTCEFHKSLRLVPCRDVEERIDTDDKREVGVRILFHEGRKGLDRVGLAGPPAFYIGDLEKRISRNRQSRHLVSVPAGRETAALERRIAGRDEEYLLEAELIPHLLGDPEVAEVDRVERPSEYADFLHPSGGQAEGALHGLRSSPFSIFHLQSSVYAFGLQLFDAHFPERFIT